MSIVTQDYYRTLIDHPSELPSGLDARLLGLVGSVKYGPGMIGEFLAKAQEIDQLAAAWKKLSDRALHRKLAGFKELFRRRSKGYQRAIPEALAAVREAAARRVGLRPYRVQLAGALALYRGFVAEMATGEGKTLTAALTAVLVGWGGLPCHIITVNDYLAQRDAKWMSTLYDFCGVSVGCVTAEMDPRTRGEGYKHDVTYTTNKEIVADFLRDRLWLGNFQDSGRRQIAELMGLKSKIDQGMVMRGIHTAIVDEADSILIDEAVTPLIISRSIPNDVFIDACRVAHALASPLKRGRDYAVKKKYKEIEIDPKLREKLAQQIRESNAQFRGVSGHMELIRQALTAREFFHLDNQYVVGTGVFSSGQSICGTGWAGGYRG